MSANAWRRRTHNKRVRQALRHIWRLSVSVQQRYTLREWMEQAP